MLKVAAITGGKDVPSARFRVRQYLPTLLDYSVNIEELKTHTCVYPPQQRWLRPAWAALRLAEMVNMVLKSRQFDVTLLQREMVSTYATLERWTGRPRVLDVDDSIHLFRDGVMAKSLALNCDRIICGNPYLADIYRQWNRDVVILPTAIDSVRYCPSASLASSDTIVLGWIGTSANLQYLEAIEPALVAVFNKYSNVKLHVVCDKPAQMRVIKSDRVEFTKWSVANELAAIQSFSIGLMPLEDSLWARGKCSFKMLQYMSCGPPVVVSPVGMNADVLKLGQIGYGPNSLSEWSDMLMHLVEDDKARLNLGLNGREIAVNKFSVATLAPRLAQYLVSIELNNEK
jgi:glycosyltransferase involved in cell wall biosynthesis